MALIICTECGKEISDKAGKCPHCGCPVKTEKRKKEKQEAQMVKCPECNNLVDADAEICHSCGTPLKNVLAKKPGMMKRGGQKKIYIIIGAIIVVALLVGIIATIFSRKTMFDQYTKYLGENIRELPKSYEHVNTYGDNYEARTENKIVVYDITGELEYSYSGVNDTEDKLKKNQIYSAEWSSDDDEYSKKEVQEFLDKFVEEYGDYDKQELIKMDWKDIYPYPRQKSYEWIDINGMDVYFYANEYYEDEYDFEYEDEDEVLTYGNLHIYWTLTEEEE